MAPPPPDTAWCAADRRRLVLETLAPVPAGRKCFRLINGVLVERTVEDVVPALQTNAEGLKSVLEGLVKEYKKIQQEMETWKVRRWVVGGRWPRADVATGQEQHSGGAAVGGMPVGVQAYGWEKTCSYGGFGSPRCTCGRPRTSLWMHGYTILYGEIFPGSVGQQDMLHAQCTGSNIKQSPSKKSE